MNVLGILFMILVISGCSNRLASEEKEKTPADLVNPLIDSHKSRFDFFASATVPYGMVALSPDTRHGDLWNSGYLYGDSVILNFSHIHNAQAAV